MMAYAPGQATAGEVPTPTPIDNPCASVSLPGGMDPIFVGEGNVVHCFQVDAPDDCCWETTVTGYAELVSPQVQCGDQTACYHVFNCDCSGCRFDFAVQVADQQLSGQCVNFTPTQTVATETATPTVTPTVDHCASVALPGGTDPIFIGEGNVDRCVGVDAPGECCWETTVTGYAELVSPQVQCGDQSACVHVPNCDCSGCNFPFQIQIADQQIDGHCVNYTPTVTLTSTEVLAATPTATPTVTVEPTDTATATPEASPTPTSEVTPTTVSVPCVGDCDDDGAVYVDEVVTLVNIILGTRPADACPTFIGEPTVAEVVTAINNALDGCPTL